MRTLFVIAGVTLLSLRVAAQTQTITFVSDTSWSVTDPQGNPLGFAQSVCGAPGAPLPPNCTAAPGGVWGADSQLSEIPGATWIWAPGLAGSTPISTDPEVLFTNAFFLAGPPVSGTIRIAADDFAKVLVNGAPAGTIGSLTDAGASAAASASLTTFDLTPFLVPGANIITIDGANASFGCTTYDCNPAGVVFGGSLEYFAITSLPIDIQPGSFPNTINPRSKGVTPVAILSVPGFDARSVVPSTVRFGKTGTETGPVHYSYQDVDLDGDLDLVLTFKTQSTGIRCGTTSAVLRGTLVTGQTMDGTDSVVTTGCK
ncbi:MAG TPA: hypothetical protein VFV19_10490 [Candidatus Polarisedimenticolaceae bacterium]|nr:hypothetical protein [Candidatus Polarisedimenticolaceae bacterium]